MMIINSGGFQLTTYVVMKKSLWYFAKYFTKNDVPTFAICHGPLVLVDTDDLKGRTITGVINVRKDLSNAGANVVDESVVVDNNIVNKSCT